MENPQERRARGQGAEELILRTVAAHADSLLRTARRYSLCPDDAQDAYQRALEIFMAHADRLDGGNAAGWLHVVVKREAHAIRSSRQRLVGASEVDLDAHEAQLPTSDERLASFDLVGRAAEALQRLKPQELRALWLKAEGHSYNEICALTGWSYTKVNRCLTEGRRSFLTRYATIESGAECERWLPVISAMVDGEATPEQMIDLRPHLRNCPGCRATLATLQGSSAPLGAILPVPLAVGAGVLDDHMTNLLARTYEAVFGGLHEKAIHSFTKAQGLIEAASAGKLAAVTASAVAVVGGSYATVERKLPDLTHDRPAKITAEGAPDGQEQAGTVGVRSSGAAGKAGSSLPKRRMSEFESPVKGAVVRSPEFPRTRELDAQFARATLDEPSAAGGSSSPPKKNPAPEFAPARGAPEFGE